MESTLSATQYSVRFSPLILLHVSHIEYSHAHAVLRLRGTSAISLSVQTPRTHPPQTARNRLGLNDKAHEIAKEDARKEAEEKAKRKAAKKAAKEKEAAAGSA